MLSKGVAHCALVHGSLIAHHLLLIFFRSAKLTFVAKGPFFAQIIKLVCDNYLENSTCFRGNLKLCVAR